MRRVVLVTGCSSGIGLAVAREAARAGHVVYAGLRDPASATELASAAGIVPLPLDVTRAAEREAAVERVVREQGRLDVLVNNAGVVHDAPLADVTDEEWTETLDTNLRAAMVCARAAIPHMIERGSGRILSAASVVARKGSFGQTAYAASKGGIVALTRTWARELGPKGITANAVAPGLIDTETMKSVPEEEMQALISRLPAGRLGRAEEVAAVYLFLASDLASFMNGAVVGVDGGLLLQ
jgi:3-oxoacyl-[acyl-carrier protein] reductase